MPHTVETNVPSVTVPAGGSASFIVIVDNAPDPSVVANVSVEYAGETVSAPITINTSDTPTTTVDGSGLTFEVGAATRNGNGTGWSVPVTVTAAA